MAEEAKAAKLTLQARNQKHSSVPGNGDTSAIKKETCAHRGTCRSKPWTRGLVIDVIIVGVVVVDVDVGRSGRHGRLQEC